MCMNCEPLIKAIDAYLQKADDDLEDTFDDEGRANPSDSVDAVNNIEDGITAALLAETDYFVKQIKKRETLSELMDDFEEIKAKDIYCDAIRAAVSEQLHKLIPPLVSSYIHFVDTEIKVNSVSQRTLAWIDSWSSELADLMKLTSHKEIETIIKNGFAAGGDIASVTLGIMDSGIRDEYWRARRAALTEVLRAHNVAKQEAAMQNPCIKEKMWKHTGDHKNEPRENHVDMDGQRVPIDQPYTLIGADGEEYHPMFPVDPILPPGEAVNCHCISQDIVDEKILALPLEERQRLQQEAIDAMDDEWEKKLDAQNRAKAGIDDEEE